MKTFSLQWLAILGATAVTSALGVASCSAVRTDGTNVASVPSPATGGANDAGPAGVARSAPEVSYFKDIRPLLDTHCTGCHTDGGIAFSLRDAEAVRNKKSTVVHAVESRQMPIWLAAPGHQSYRDDPTLSDAEIDLFRRWRDGGFAWGSPSDAPKEAKGAPAQGDIEGDFRAPLLAKGVSYLPDQNNADDYRCFLVEWPYRDQVKYMTGMQVVPGKREVVHHLVVFGVDAAIAPALHALDAEEPGPGYQCLGGPLPDRLSDPKVQKRIGAKFPGVIDLLKHGRATDWLGHWAPGMRGTTFPEGTGMPLRKGGLVVVQVHYYSRTAPGVADTGGEIRFALADRVAKPGFMLPLSYDPWLDSEVNRTLVVPPGKKATVQYAMSLNDVLEYGKAATGLKGDVEALELHTVNVHMHSYGASAQTYLEAADGSRDVLLDIPRWDINWQRNYVLNAPKVIKPEEAARMKIDVSCTFANDGSKEVIGGLGSNDEMCFDFSFFALRPKARL
ncbi:MAG TPA: hypothetical protein VGI39_27320 [Polyangiaceae bacterium]